MTRLQRITVVGLGPAGRALAHRLLAHRSPSHAMDLVCLDPDPDRVWEQTFGGWSSQLPSWLPTSVVATHNSDVVIRAREVHGMPGDYLVLDTPALQRALTLNGARVEQGRVSDTDLADLPGLVVDCRGSQPAGSSGITDAPAQTAFGLVLPAQSATPMLRDDLGIHQAILMDWRHPEHRPWESGEPASFCYVIPVQQSRSADEAGGRVLVEETCLAGHPALSTNELRDRLLRRLRTHGVTDISAADTEVVYIPLLPATRQHPFPAFGTAGDQLNPVTGFSVFASLSAADNAAMSLLRTGTLPTASSLTRTLRRTALDALLQLPASAAVDLFESFAGMSITDQQAVFDPTASASRLLHALTRQWWGLPSRSKVQLMVATTRPATIGAAEVLIRSLVEGRENARRR